MICLSAIPTIPPLRLLTNFPIDQVRDDPKLLGDSGEVSIYKWSGWQFDSRFDIFSLLDRIN
jgi:hypothetical protein